MLSGSSTARSLYTEQAVIYCTQVRKSPATERNRQKKRGFGSSDRRLNENGPVVTQCVCAMRVTVEEAVEGYRRLLEK